MLVRLLGPVDVTDDEGIVRHSGSALRRALLALLALRCGRVVAPDWLLEHLWAGDAPDSGLRALRFHVSQLRKEIGDLVPIETRPGGYCLELPSDSVDALVFEDRARQARLESNDERAAASCAAALSLWRGDPFIDAAGCATLDHEAVRLEELRVTIVEEGYVRQLAAGAGGELIAELLQLVTEHPLREALWSSLIVAQYRAGQQAEALRTYERLRSTLAETLGLDPSAELQSLQFRVLRHDPGLMSHRRVEDRAATPSRNGNLPAATTSFVEARGTVNSVEELVAANRIVTLTGLGGVGKTRLAIEVAGRCGARFRDGVRLVELAPVADPEAVSSVIAASLGVTPHGGGVSLLESIVDWCSTRQLLVVLDNCEHVIDAAAQTVEVLAARCPTVTLLTTSREALGLIGEHVYCVAPLERDEAIELFTDRAVAADMTFTLEPYSLGAVEALCERLDGLPLAIELAAGRVRSMSPAELLERTNERFDLLRASPRGREDRHQTLRAAVAWSYQLLGDSERIVFERASVFSGSFDLAAAEAVCGADAVDATDFVDHLCRLVDKSLVSARRDRSGTRYRLLETLREFAAEQLRVRGDDEATRGRHLRHYVNVATHADRLFRGPRQLEGRQIFDDEWDNVRAAHASAVSTWDLDGAENILAAARVYAESRIRVEVGDWAERTLAIESPGRSPRPETFGQAASWANWAGHHELACRRVARGVEGAPSSDHPSTALCWSQVPIPYRGDALIDGAVPTATAALRHLESASASFDTEQDWWVLVSLVERAMACVDEPDTTTECASDIVRHHLERLLEVTDRVRAPSFHANAALFEGHELMDRTPPEPRAALEAYQRALTLTDQVDDVSLGGSARRAVALAITYQSADEDAVRACLSALRWLHDKRNWYRIWQTMESVALVLATREDVEGAAIVLGHLEAWHAPFGREASFGFRTRALNLARCDSRANAWMARGAIMERDELVPYALERLGAEAPMVGPRPRR